MHVVNRHFLSTCGTVLTEGMQQRTKEMKCPLGVCILVGRSQTSNYIMSGGKYYKAKFKKKERKALTDVL